MAHQPQNFDELKLMKYGERGNPKREQFQLEAFQYSLGEKLRQHRLELNLSQSELSQRIGKTSEWIDQVEQGNINISVYEMFQVVEIGLGKKLSFHLH